MVILNNEETKKILFFQQVTGAAVRDCMEDVENIVFVVAEGEMGQAIGKNGKNIKDLQRMLKKGVFFVEYSSDLSRFVENIFFPTKIGVNLTDDKIMIKVDPENRKYVIGKGGQKIKMARALVGRHFGEKEIKI
jgi:N utilization substance protein A